MDVVRDLVTLVRAQRRLSPGRPQLVVAGHPRAGEERGPVGLQLADRFEQLLAGGQLSLDNGVGAKKRCGKRGHGTVARARNRITGVGNGALPRLAEQSSD